MFQVVPPPTLALLDYLPEIVACVAILAFVVMLLSSLAPRHTSSADYLRLAMAERAKRRASKVR